MRKLFAKIRGFFQPRGEIRTLAISEGETPPDDTPQELKTLFANPGFWRELDDDYYENRPEEWENETFYVDAEFYKPIISGLTDSYTRARLSSEWVTEDAIWRAGRAIRRIGRISNVTTNPRGDEDQKRAATIGKIRLAKITPVEKDAAPTAAKLIQEKTFRKNGDKEIIARGEGKDILTFEVVEND